MSEEGEREIEKEVSALEAFPFNFHSHVCTHMVFYVGLTGTLHMYEPPSHSFLLSSLSIAFSPLLEKVEREREVPVAKKFQKDNQGGNILCTFSLLSLQLSP